MLERGSELAVIADRIVRAAKERTGCTVALRGPAGIGKSTVLELGTEAARAQGFAVARARAGELESSIPFGVVRQLVESPALQEAVGAARDGPAAAALAVLGGSDAGPDPASIMHAFWWIVAEAAEEQPLALVVDDAHWADTPSLAWLAYVGRRSADHALLSLLAARPILGNPSLDALLADRTVTLLDPAPLGSAAIAEIVRSTVGTTPSEDFVAACVSTTGGNPLYLHELLVSARGSAVEPDDAGARRLHDLGPASIAMSVIARCRSAHPRGERLAEAVAALGEHAELRHAAEVAGLTMTESARVVEALVTWDVFAPDKPLRLRHPVLRAAVLEALSWPRRAELHANAARVLSAEGADAETIAVHLLETEPAGDAAAADVLLAAGRTARTRGDVTLAHALLSRALAEPPAPDIRPEADLELGVVGLDAGDAGAIERLHAVAGHAGVPSERRAEAVIAAARAMPIGPARVAFLEQSLGSFEHDDREVRLLLESEVLLAGMYGGRPEDVIGRAAGLAAEVSEGRTRGERLVLEALVRLAVYDNRPIGEVLRLIEPVARHTIEDDPAGAVHSSGVIALLSAYGRTGTARALAQQLLDRGVRTGSVVERLSGETLLGVAIAYDGDLATAETLLSGFGDTDRERLFGGKAAEQIQFAMPVLVDRGRLAAGEAMLDDWPDSSIEKDSFDWGRVLAARAMLRLAQRRYHEAVADATRAGEFQARFGMARCNHALLPWRPLAAVAHFGTGDRAAATALSDETLRIAREFGEPRLLGIALRVKALMGARRDAERLLREALGLLESTPHRVEVARVLVDLGRSQRQQRQPVQARDPLRRALDLATQCGAHAIAAYAHEELLAAGARPRRRVLSGAESLTPAELRVARLAADGLSNPEIAQTLFITRKSVEHHLSGAYRKLEIASRDALAGALSGMSAEPV